jgi:acylphosphatase
MPPDSVHLTIHGRVQGVGYRDWASREADRLGLSGWVRNRRDGTVEAVISGEAEAVAQFLSRCREGPSAALVTDVKSEVYEAPLPKGFNQLPTA